MNLNALALARIESGEGPVRVGLIGAGKFGSMFLNQAQNREDWIAHRDFAPIEAVADDALLKYAKNYSIAAMFMARDDGMPEPRAMNIAVFLDEVMAINGPLMIIPKSHKHGVFEAGHDLETTSYPLWTLDKETITRLAEEGSIIAPTGKPGAVLMFHGNLVHASPPNITPYPRKIVYLTLCAVSNHITKFTREDWIAHRDFAPIEAVADDALLRFAKNYSVAAE